MIYLCFNLTIFCGNTLTNPENPAISRSSPLESRNNPAKSPPESRIIAMRPAISPIWGSVEGKLHERLYRLAICTGEFGVLEHGGIPDKSDSPFADMIALSDLHIPVV